MTPIAVQIATINSRISQKVQYFLQGKGDMETYWIFEDDLTDGID